MTPHRFGWVHIKQARNLNQAYGRSIAIRQDENLYVSQAAQHKVMVRFDSR